MRRLFAGWGAMISVWLLAVLLAGCGGVGNGGQDVILVEDGAAETQMAQTAFARQNPSATPGPSPLPPAEPTPYAIPTNPPGVDGSTVITRVGGEEITLSEFQKRVRFERWLPLYRLADRAESQGAGQVLNLTLPENQNTLALFATLADSNSFGMQVQRIMVIEAIALEEAIRRGLEIDPAQYEAKLATYVGLMPGDGGELPPEFEAEYDAFLEDMHTYTGMNEEDFRRIVRAQVLYSMLQFDMGREPDAVQPDQVNIGRSVQDILVSTRTDAEQVVERLEAGDAMQEIAESLGLTSATGDPARTIHVGDPNLPASLVDDIFAAQPGDIVGPVDLTQGWYVAKVGQEVFEMPSPQQVDAMRQRYFLDWVESQMDDPSYTEDYENWFEHIPQAPLPIDVSPLLREENMILPETTPLPEDMSLPDSELAPEARSLAATQVTDALERTAEPEAQ